MHAHVEEDCESAIESTEFITQMAGINCQEDQTNASQVKQKVIDANHKELSQTQRKATDLKGNCDTNRETTRSASAYTTIEQYTMEKAITTKTAETVTCVNSTTNTQVVTAINTLSFGGNPLEVQSINKNGRQGSSQNIEDQATMLMQQAVVKSKIDNIEGQAGMDTLFQMLNAMNVTLNKIQTDVEDMKNTRKTLEEKIEGVCFDQEDNHEAIQELMKETRGCVDKVDLLTNIVIKQEEQINELSSK